MDDDDLMNIDIDGLSSSEEDESGNLNPEELFDMMNDDDDEAPVVTKRKRQNKSSDKGKEEEEEEDDDEMEYLFEDTKGVEDLLNGDVIQEEEDEMEFNSSEERGMKKKEAAARKLESKIKPKKKKKKKTHATTPQKKRSKTTQDTSSMFPNKKDMIGLMAFIHSSGYTSICKGSEGGDLSDAQKEQVDDKAFALANFFSKRMDSVITNISESIKAVVSKKNTPESIRLANLFDALKKYRRLAIPGVKDSYRPEAICPFTLGNIDHQSSVKMVIIPDEEDSVPIMFYTDVDVAGVLRAFHTLYHFGAYFDLDLQKFINSAKKTLESGTEDPEIVWDAMFNPMESIPKQKKDQQPGTRLVSLKQDMLANLCKAVRAFVGDEPFKV